MNLRILWIVFPLLFFQFPVFLIPDSLQYKKLKFRGYASAMIIHYS